MKITFSTPCPATGETGSRVYFKKVEVIMHTQGNWEISKHATPDYAPQYGIHNGRRNDFCIVKGENAEANAQLIAAAPELLRAVKGEFAMLNSLPMTTPDQDSRLEQLELLIAKAQA